MSRTIILNVVERQELRLRFAAASALAAETYEHVLA